MKLTTRASGRLVALLDCYVINSRYLIANFLTFYVPFVIRENSGTGKNRPSSGISSTGISRNYSYSSSSMIIYFYPCSYDTGFASFTSSYTMVELLKESSSITSSVVSIPDSASVSISVKSKTSFSSIVSMIKIV